MMTPNFKPSSFRDLSEPKSLLSSFDEDDNPRRTTVLASSPLVDVTSVTLNDLSLIKTPRGNNFSPITDMEIADLKRELKRVQDLLRNAETEKNKAQQDNSKLEHQLLQAEKNMKLSAELGDTYLNTNQKLSDDITEEKQRKKLFQDEISQLQRRTQQMHAENQQLQKAKTQNQAFHGQYQKLQQQFRNEVNNVAAMKAQFQELNQQLQKEKQTACSLREHNTALSHKNQELQRQLISSNEKVEQFQQDVKKRAVENSHLRSQVSQTQVEASHRNAELHDRVTKLEAAKRAWVEKSKAKDDAIRELQARGADVKRKFAQSLASPQKERRGVGLSLSDQLGSSLTSFSGGSGQCDHSDICNAVDVLKRETERNFAKLFGSTSFTGSSFSDVRVREQTQKRMMDGIEKAVQASLAGRLKNLDANLQKSFERLATGDELKRSLDSVKQSVEKGLSSRRGFGKPNSNGRSVLFADNDTETVLKDLKQLPDQITKLSEKVRHNQGGGGGNDIWFYAACVFGAVCFIAFCLFSLTPGRRSYGTMT